MNRRDCLLATLFAAAVAPALASTPPAIAPPSVTSVDERKVQESLEVQRSTLVVDGLDPSALTKEYLGMLKAGGVDCWHQSVGGLASFAALHNDAQLTQRVLPSLRRPRCRSRAVR